jgi:uncharacterized membrane protein YdjX (TVP38/TMEM64 family)
MSDSPETEPITTAPTEPAVALEGRAKYIATPLAALWGTFPGIAGFVALGFIASLNDWIKGFGEQGWFVYVALFAICSGFGLLPTYAMSMIGGWIFGATTGTLGAICGFMGGALIGYAITKVVAGEAFQRWLDAKPKARVIRDVFLGHGQGRMLGTVIALRFPPSSPFSLMNFVLTATGVRIVPYVLGTLIGMSPRTAVAAWIAATAAAAGEQNFQTLFVKRPVEFIVGAVLTVIILMVLANIGHRALIKAGLAKG